MAGATLYTVIVADDEDELREAVCTMIPWEELGFRLAGSAGNGLDALQLVEKYEPDLLLTDIRMPFISGIELARQVREVRPATNIAFLSGYDDFAYAQQAIQYNIISYMLKPLTIEGLGKELRAIRQKIDAQYALFRKSGPVGGEQKVRAAEVMPLVLDGYAEPEPEAQLEAYAREVGLLRDVEDRPCYTVMVSTLLSREGTNRTTPSFAASIDRLASKYLRSVSFFSGGKVVTVLLGRRMKIEPVSIDWRETYRQGRGIAALGIYMTVSGFITTLYSYLFVAWLNSHSGTGEVGYYQAGYTLVMQYVGLVFTAMSMEYYPRLSVVCEDRALLSEHVSRQVETSLLILVPFISLFIVLQTLIIHILYTADFLAIGGYISWAALGMLFRAFSWSVSFVLLAKGAGRLYLITEVLADSLMFVLYLLGYTRWGLAGVGVAYLLAYLCSGTGIYLLCRIKYGLRVPLRVFGLLGLSVAGCAVVLLLWQGGQVIGAWVATAMWVLLAGWQLKRRLL